MKQWQETAQVLRRLGALAAAGRQAALATVVDIQGSSYRRPGAKLLIDDAGDMMGGVSGGCLEADVRERASTVLRDGKPQLRHYDTSADEDALWGLGLGCNGTVDVFIQPVEVMAQGPIERIRTLLAGDRPFAVATVLDGPVKWGSIVVLDGDGNDAVGSCGDPAADSVLYSAAAARLAAGDSARARHGKLDVFVEVMRPPPRLLVFGAGDDARPLVALAATIGFRVCVVDHRPAYLTEQRFPDAARLVGARFEDGTAQLPVGPDSYAVVMSHSLTHDGGWVRQLVRTAVPYVGLLGPRGRTEEIVDALDAESRSRVFGPVGVDVGADGPEQVALSIVAELLAVRTGREPRHLRDRTEAIHAE